MALLQRSRMVGLNKKPPIHRIHSHRMFLADHYRSKNKFEETKFIFPNAPNIPITVNMGMR